MPHSSPFNQPFNQVRELVDVGRLLSLIKPSLQFIPGMFKWRHAHAKSRPCYDLHLLLLLVVVVLLLLLLLLLIILLMLLQLLLLLLNLLLLLLMFLLRHPFCHAVHLPLQSVAPHAVVTHTFEWIN